MNKVIITGRLGADPDVRYMTNGDAVCNISIASSERWKGKDGEKKEHTEWHNLVFFGRSAEIVGEYLRKGSKLMIEGKLRTRKWQDKQGADRYTTEIHVEGMEMLDSKPADSSGSNHRDHNQSRPAASRPAPAASKPAQQSNSSFDNFDDDIPF